MELLFQINIDKWLDIALKAAALLAAGIYFLYRAWAGYMTVNLSVSLSLERKKRNGQERDLVVASVVLKKGNEGKLLLCDVKVRLRVVADTPASQNPVSVSLGDDVSQAYSEESGPNYVIQQLTGIRRLTRFKNEVYFFKHAEDNLLKLAPGDEMNLGCIFEVPSNGVCVVDIVVLGSKTFGHRRGQWRASRVSLPLV
jgi:hypothetical protein